MKRKKLLIIQLEELKTECAKKFVVIRLLNLVPIVLHKSMFNMTLCLCACCVLILVKSAIFQCFHQELTVKILHSLVFAISWGLTVGNYFKWNINKSNDWLTYETMKNLEDKLRKEN